MDMDLRLLRSVSAQLRLVSSVGGVCSCCLRSVRVGRLAVAGKAGTM